MFEIDPRDRPLYLAKRRNSVRLLAIPIFIVAILAGAGFTYWQVSSVYSQAYAKLDISPLPLGLELQPQFYDQISRLNREPCYRDAIVVFSEALIKAGYPREGASSLLSFMSRCKGSENDELLIRAFDAFNKVGDYSKALGIADQLVKTDQANPQYRYWRGVAFEQQKNFAMALSDYVSTLQLMGNLSEIAGSQFYDVSRMYAELNRYCDAIGPIETFISFNPAERRTPQAMQLISEYNKKGSCDAHYASGSGRVLVANTGGVRTVPVSINGVSGEFILDTGADYVTLTPNFAARSKLAVETGNPIPMRTAGGFARADLGSADVIAVGGARAEKVVVSVIRGVDDPFGNHLDGLLGMSFLARFNTTVSQDGIQLSAIPLN
jgi:clan AA aspartic protease (TIGR02281 family)